MGNILAIARRELKSYFASPIAYVIVGMFALLFGWFFNAILNYFLRQSMQVGQYGQTTVNVNQLLMRPLFLNMSVIVLMVMPFITMRTYSEEKRSGTIELLLTSPLTDFQIIMGKFLGALVLYAVMLAVGLPNVAALFLFGNPEWQPIAAGYLGLLLLGGSFISIGLLISSLTKNQIIAAMITFAALLMLWIVNWMSESSSPTTQQVMSYLSITEHFDDFAKGVIDTKHLVYYFSLTTLGLFLTAKSVDSERWRG